MGTHIYRQEAVGLIRGKPDGTFLIRDPSEADRRKAGDFTLVFRNGNTRQVKLIHADDRTYCLGHHTTESAKYLSVPELIEVHKHSPLSRHTPGLNAVLTNPVLRPESVKVSSICLYNYILAGVFWSFIC